MNKQSSRSHCVFTMNVSSSSGFDGSTMECWVSSTWWTSPTSAPRAPAVLLPSAAARQSLQPQRPRHRLLQGWRRVQGLPRGQLTRLLGALSGRCKITSIATVPEGAVEETLSTLQYQSAHGIVNKPTADNGMPDISVGQ